MHAGSESGPISIPPLEQWSTQTGADEEWSEGPIPSVTLPASSVSEFLYVDYGFEDGVEYTITLTHTTSYISGISNPRTVTLAILDNSFVTQFSELDTFPPSPGGQKSISINFTANADCTKIGFKASSGSNVTIVVDEASGTSIDNTDPPTSLQIDEPDGWKQAVMKLARDQDFHSLIEFFDGSFIFYGDNGVVNGGLHYIEDLEVTRGVDVNISILIEIAPDDITYEDCFFGQLNLAQGERLPKNKYRIPVIKDDFWAKFYSRWKTPVDLQSATDLDGSAVVPVEPINLILPSQTIQKKYIGEIANGSFSDPTIGGPDWTVGEFVQIDMDTDIQEEIEEKFHIPTASNPEIPVNLFFMLEAGAYEFDIRLEASAINNLGEQYSLIGYLSMFIQFGSDAPIPLTETDYGPALGESTVYTYQDTVDIPANTPVTIYGEMIADINVHGGSTFFFLWPSDFALTPSGAGKSEGDLRANHLYVTGQTTFPETQEETFLLHDVAAAILKSYGIGEDNPFYSELLGSALTKARQYDSDGCAWEYALIKGLQLRGYTLAAKPFAQSFEQWWKGIDPILCLGLSYDFIPGSTLDPVSSNVEDLFDWDDAAGPNPGAWNYAVFGFPFTSVNGNSGVEGFTCGLWATTAGVTYALTTLVEIFETGGVNPLDINFIWAVLDAGFNEIITQEFNYSTYGFHHEVFNITPPSDGVYLAVRLVNDTAFDTKTVMIRMAIGDPTEQLLLNEDFDSASVWTNENAGADWAVGGGVATVSLVSGSSKGLTQEISNGDAGDYVFASEYRPTGVGGGDQLDLIVNFYDSGDNLISSKTESTFNNDTKPWHWAFTSIVPVAKIEMIADLSVGTNADVELPYAGLFLTTLPEAVIVPDERIIRVEEREYFYQEEMSVLISNIEEITRKYDEEIIFNKVEIGYSQWQSEDVSGIDDPQSKRVYSTRFQKIGQGITIHSDFIAASLAIETTRRQTIQKSADYKFDNNTFIIAINADDVSPDSYAPELGSAFSSVLNLLNFETRYNVRLSVARNFLRWRKWFNGCLQSYLNSFFKFVSGEGNFDMVTTFDESPDCLEEDNEGQSLSEKQDIEVTDHVTITPHYYEIEVPMEWETYKTIRENRRNAIGISLTSSDHVPLFIEQLEYEVMNGKAKISGWTKAYFPLEVIEGPAATQDCSPTALCINPITDEFGEPITDEFGVCITEGAEAEGIFDDTFDDTFE